MAKIDSFVFYRSFYEAIKELPDQDRLNIFDSICEYALDHNEIERTSVAKGMMTLITPLLDANYKRRANGSQGGRPKTAQSGEESEDKADNQGTKPNLDETKTKPSQNQSITEGEPNVNVNGNVNVNEDVNEDSIKLNAHGQKPFQKPTIEEVETYCIANGYSEVEAERFYNYYEKNDWTVKGKNGSRRKMKNWKLCINSWVVNEIRYSQTNDLRNRAREAYVKDVDRKLAYDKKKKEGFGFD